jgi:hypothetical protein
LVEQTALLLATMWVSRLVHRWALHLGRPSVPGWGMPRVQLSGQQLGSLLGTCLEPPMAPLKDLVLVQQMVTHWVHPTALRWATHLAPPWVSLWAQSLGTQ